MRMIRLNKERIYLHAPNACVIAAVSVSPAPPVNELEDAIRRAAARHGSLAMRVERRSEGENGYEQCEPKLEISHDRLESEFDWLGEADDLREYVFDTASGEMARFVILEGEGETQLVCGVHRLAGDERSVVLLLSEFKTIKRISAASVEELSCINGISRRDAENIVEYFGSQKTGARTPEADKSV